MELMRLVPLELFGLRISGEDAATATAAADDDDDDDDDGDGDDGDGKEDDDGTVVLVVVEITLVSCRDGGRSTEQPSSLPKTNTGR